MADACSTTANQVLTILCDKCGNVITKTNAELEIHNRNLQPAEDLLRYIEISLTHFFEKKIDVTDFDHCVPDETDVCYEVNLAVPYDKINHLHLSICGNFFHAHDVFASCPSFSMTDSGDVKLGFRVCPWMHIEGSVTDYAGTLEDIEFLINTNQITMHFMNIGMVSVATRQPIHTGDGTASRVLEGAVFNFKKLMLDKATIQELLDCLGPETSKLSDLATSLARVNPFHKTIVDVTDKRDALIHTNTKLKLCQDLAQTISICSPTGEVEPLVLKIQDGKERQLITRDGRGLVFWPKKGTTSTIPVSQIGKLWIHLSNLDISARHGLHFPQFTPDGCLVRQLSRGVTALFTFDESLEAVDMESIPGGILHFIVSQVTPGVAIDYQAPPALLNLTMHLFCLEIDLDLLQSRLDALGIVPEQEVSPE